MWLKQCRICVNHLRIVPVVIVTKPIRGLYYVLTSVLFVWSRIGLTVLWPKPSYLFLKWFIWLESQSSISLTWDFESQLYISLLTFLLFVNRMNLLLISHAKCNVLNVVRLSRAEQAAFGGQERGKAWPRDRRTPSWNCRPRHLKTDPARSPGQGHDAEGARNCMCLCENLYWDNCVCFLEIFCRC